MTPDLIPHSEFHTGIWLLPVDRPVWYYFMKKRNENAVNARQFIKSVDKPLRRLVRFLHQRGIRTTPSCSGHHISERNLEKIYDSLEKDREDIRKGGLKLKDVETGKIYWFRNENYSLPWSREEFIEKVSVYQQKGVIGLRFGKFKRARAIVLNARIDGVTIEERDGIVFIFTNEDHKGDNKQTWKLITKMVKRAFGTSEIVKSTPAYSLVDS